MSTRSSAKVKKGMIGMAGKNKQSLQKAKHPFSGNLLARAKAVSRNAYAPHSGCKIGAAVLTEKGIFNGCNVENASFGLTICAERTAVFSAIAAGAKKVKRIAIFCSKIVPFPCGACLQVLSEFATPDTFIEVSNGKKVVICNFASLLPRPFHGKQYRK